MQQLFLSTFLIVVISVSLSSSGMWLGCDWNPEQFQKDADLYQKQHILELCRSTKKEDAHCKEINHIFARSPKWFKMNVIQQIYNYGKKPMPEDISRAVLYSQAKQFGAKLGWDQQRIEKESHLLVDEYSTFLDSE